MAAAGCPLLGDGKYGRERINRTYKLPSLYRAFLTSFRLPQNIRNDNFLCSIIEDKGDLGPLWLAIDCPQSMNEVSKNIEILQEIRDFCELPEDCFRNLIPIGDWGGGWGPLCIDLSIPEEEIDENDPLTWSLVWFDHEEFDWNEEYLSEDGLLHGSKALPDLKKLLELYFYGALEERFEQNDADEHHWLYGPVRSSVYRLWMDSCRKNKQNCQKTNICKGEQKKVRPFLFGKLPGDLPIRNQACHRCDQGSETT